MYQIASLAAITLAAAMSPGPDFAMIMRNSLIYSRRVGVLSAIGVGVGLQFHVAYCILGLGLIISKSVLLFSAIKLAGAFYLIIIGWKGMRARRPQGEKERLPNGHLLSHAQALKTGFFTNVLNPKATIFVLSVFTQVIDPNTSLPTQIFYGLIFSSIHIIWFIAIALFLSHRRFQRIFEKFETVLERAFGGVLAIFGISLALATVDQ